MNIEIAEGWSNTPNWGLIRGCILKNFRTFTRGKSVHVFFAQKASRLLDFGGMFLLPAPLCPMWNGNGDFCGWIGGI